ncbi:GIY-YIG nuclease family protein [Flavobacterium hiemivividum]|uniref:GIY-YIG nuclease family protein n=1 Tax=Flavobacterium hiemivividum TaxID=2541734 RepID=UPI001404D872|nr:GIY-YIG nuclease family protein [Flavobacterium hiemivividum]
MNKIIKQLPEYYCLSSAIQKDTKTTFYIGTSDLISEKKTDIFNTKYGINTLICDKEKVQIFKIGVTKNLETRLKYYNKEISDFRIIKSWNIKNPTELEQRLIEDNYKDDFSTYGSEWFWDVENQLSEFIEKVEWYIENTYTPHNYGYTQLYK